MASTKYYLQSKNNSAPIYLRFSDGSKFNIKRKTGLVINPRNWSKKTNYPITKDKSTKELKSKLFKLEGFVLDEYNNDNTVGKIIDGHWLESKINLFFKRTNYDNPFETIFGIIDYIILTAHTRKNGKGSVGLSKNRIKAYKNLKVVLSKFSRNKNISIKSIDRNYLNQLVDWLIQDQKYSVSTANKKISDIKSLCFEAERHGVTINQQVRHFRRLNDPRPKLIIILNRRELEQIETQSINNKSLINVRKWLLFGCEVGQRLDDLLSISEKDIKTSNNQEFRILTITQRKVNKTVHIPLNPKAEELIKDGLPYKISKQVFNRQVKILCQLCGIDEELKHYKRDATTKRNIGGSYKKYELISGHVCRRSFASNYYGEMPNSLIMKVTGHVQERTFLKYIGKSDEDFTNLIYSEMLKSLKH
ncbi:tyrosine-type recombinase/integrase [Winogradskyella tangerina]|uniref:tyrosine-type recombinase/integrase n=1 Tax=Winogradskyella tangerina TaxID=2023240 RepID=UPI000DBE6B0C|nr:tyrosine-type recombinase/integrase [Winogradskyella tangerina]